MMIMNGDFDDIEERDDLVEEAKDKGLHIENHEDDIEPLEKVYTRLSDRGLSVIESDRETAPAESSAVEWHEEEEEEEERPRVEKGED